MDPLIFANTKNVGADERALIRLGAAAVCLHKKIPILLWEEILRTAESVEPMEKVGDFHEQVKELMRMNDPTRT